MKELIEYIVEASEQGNKTFFKDFKGLYKIGSYGEKWYDEVNKWVEKYNLVMLPEDKLEKPTNQPLLTLLLSKKNEHQILDLAVTRPGKKTEIEGGGTVNLAANPVRYLDTVKDYEKWYKEYRGIIKIQFAFPNGFFDNVRSYLGDKLMK